MFLVYGGNEELVVKGYVDASFDTDLDDSKSQTGYVKHVLCPFQVLQDILDRCPVFLARITLVPSYQTYGKVYIRSGTQHGIHNRPYS